MDKEEKKNRPKDKENDAQGLTPERWQTVCVKKRKKERRGHHSNEDYINASNQEVEKCIKKS